MLDENKGCCLLDYQLEISKFGFISDRLFTKYLGVYFILFYYLYDIYLVIILLTYWV